MPGQSEQTNKSSGFNRLLSIALVLAALFFLFHAMQSCSRMQEESTTSTAANTASNNATGAEVGGGNTWAQTSTTEPTAPTTAQEGEAIVVEGMREHYVNTSAAETATVMVYMTGADLETYNGAATKDIKEMVQANLGPNVRVVLQTGGAKRWHFASQANPRTRQRWEINNEGMYLLEDIGPGTMLDTQSVTDFVNFSTKNYPADRYLFVFWDHGGGTIGGYGRDEVYPNAAPLSLLQLRQALANSGTKFDMVGFDACLMGTIETAYAMEPVADYMLASEEYEMGDGWAWTGMLTALGQNPAIDTVELGKVAIDDFTDFYFSQRLGNITLSLVDLREVPHVYEKMGEFLAAAEQTITNDNQRFIEMSQARTKARSFADGGMDQVDVADLIVRTNFEGKDELLAAVKSCVKYQSGTTISGANGLAMYFPYSEVRQYSGMRSILNDIGYVRPTEFYDYFLSIMGGSGGNASHGLIDWFGGAYEAQGSAASAASSSGTYADSTFSAEDWFEQLLGSFTYQQVPTQLDMTEQDGEYVIQMNNQLWNVFSNFQTTVMEEFGSGYMMLGRDDVYDQTSDGNIAVFYNNEWLTINGQPVSFFSNAPSEEANGEYSHSGIIPALLNGKTYIEISVYWPPASQQGDEGYVGQIQGYRMDNPSLFTFGRGLIPFQAGDTITPLFDLYDKQGQYVETQPGNTITVDNPDALKVTYELFDHNTVHFWGTMTTVYGDKIDTAVVTQ